MKLVVCILATLVTVTWAVEEVPHHGSHHPVREPHEVNGEHNPEFDHEAVIGSRSGHDEFEDLPPEEAKKRLGVLVEKMDLNNDGQIDEGELTEWVYNSYLNLDSEEAQEYFREQDKDEDGMVTFKEYLENYYGFDPDETADWENDENPEMEAYAKLVKDDEKKFNRADKNSDGGLDQDEYNAFYHPWDHPEMHEFEIERALAESDNNGDGFIDLKEYLGSDTDDRESELVEAENFKDFDKNNDQKLDREEIKGWVIPDPRETALDEALHLIDKTDADDDGVLTKDEILDKYEAWVGSAATDYGSQLNKLHDPSEL